jgi:nucleoside 2-deoxyribosyltransferase
VIHSGVTIVMKKLNVYLASRHEDRPEIVKIRKCLIANNINVTSRWLTQGGVIKQLIGVRKCDIVENQREGCLRVQTNDLEDIDAADVVVVFSPKKAFCNSTGGRHVEFGYALGTKKPLILVGFRENVFHWNPKVVCVRTKKELYEVLKAAKRTFRK